MAGTTPVTPFRRYTGADGEFHLPTKTNEFTPHQFGAVCGDDILKFIFENVVSVNPLHSDGIQLRFSSLGPASPSPCSHH